MLEHAAALAGMLATLSLGVMSPGPSFVMVARTAVARSRREALAAAIGMGLGGAAFALAALLGLQALLLAWPALFTALKVAGGVYLLWLAFCMWQGAAEPLHMGAAEPGEQGKAVGSSGRGLLLGLATQLSNPKTAVVYASVFAAFLPPEHGLAFNALVVMLAFTVEAAWYAAVAWLLSGQAPRLRYLRNKRWFDRAAAAALGVLGGKLLFSAS
jgi:threonine/homoserine/homoserine lactone efflux protein